MTLVWGKQARPWVSINEPENKPSFVSCSDSSFIEALERMNDLGFLVVRDAIPECLVTRLHDGYAHLWLKGWQKKIPAIHQGINRADCALNFVGPALFAVRTFAQRMHNFLVAKLGEEPTVEELALLISFPGAAEQPFHPDSEPSASVAPMLTVFIPLEDVSLAMGPLEIVPGSNGSTSIHDEAASTVLDVEAGTAVVMDSTTWHRGRGNYSLQSRPVFYFSLLGSGAKPNGPTWTMGDGRGGSPFGPANESSICHK